MISSSTFSLEDCTNYSVDLQNIMNWSQCEWYKIKERAFKKFRKKKKSEKYFCEYGIIVATALLYSSILLWKIILGKNTLLIFFFVVFCYFFPLMIEIWWGPHTIFCYLTLQHKKIFLSVLHLHFDFIMYVLHLNDTCIFIFIVCNFSL